MTQLRNVVGAFVLAAAWTTFGYLLPSPAPRAAPRSQPPQPPQPPAKCVSTWVAPVNHDDGECSVEYATPFGSFWARPGDLCDLVQVVEEQGYPDSAHLYERGHVFLRKGDVVLDGGANLGIFTRIALDRGAAKVIAFEPNERPALCFKKTFSREIESGLVVLQTEALWESEGTLDFSGGGLGGTVSAPDGGKTAHPVAATTIDRTVHRLGLKRVDFVKMDIEGAERFALKGAKETLARYGPRLAILADHRPDDYEAIPPVVLEGNPAYHTLVGPLPRNRPGEPHWGGLLFFSLE